MLRDYQVRAIDQIRGAFNSFARKVLLHLATGAGKTVIFCYILNKLFEVKVKAFMVVRRRKLVNQASKRLRREGVPHGVLMAKHWNKRPYEGIQVCSIDTLISGKYHPKTEACKEKCNGNHLEAETIIVDEGHDATTDSYKDFLDQYPEALILTVTATPYGLKSLAHLADAVVYPISMLDLAKQGYLVLPRYFCPQMPDLSKVKIEGGEYNQIQLAEAMDKNELIGNIVEHYKTIAPGVKFMAFAVDVSNSQHIAKKFCDNGIRVVHCDADTPDKEREKILEEFQDPASDLMGITNVNIFATGADIPFLPCIISARPTQSYNLFIQQAGRGTRPIYKEGMPLDTVEQRLEAIKAGPKQNFIYLDHSGNVLRHGFITDEKEANVGKDAIRIGKAEFSPSTPITTCWKCFAGYRGDACPNGCPPPVVEIKDENEGKLEEITNMPEEEFFLKRMELIRENYKKKHGKALKKGFIYYKFLEKFGPEKTSIYFPPKKPLPGFVQKKIEQRKLAQAATDFLRSNNYAEA